MLYPKEDIAERRSSGRKVLVYHCRSCMKKEAIEEMKDPVHSNIVVDTSRENSKMNYNVVLDPTLPRTYIAKCRNQEKECSCTEAVYYQSPIGKHDEALILVFVCVNCETRWLSSDPEP